MSFDIDITYDFSAMRAYLFDRQLKFVAWYKRFLAIQIKLLARDLKRDMQTGTKTGRWYLKAQGNGMYRASAKGETPAVDTGKLLRSVRIQKHDGGLTVTATTGTDYVQHLISLKRAFFKPFYEARASGILQGLKQGGFLN